MRIENIVQHSDAVLYNQEVQYQHGNCFVLISQRGYSLTKQWQEICIVKEPVP